MTLVRETYDKSFIAGFDEHIAELDTSLRSGSLSAQFNSITKNKDGLHIDFDDSFTESNKATLDGLLDGFLAANPKS